MLREGLQPLDEKIPMSNKKSWDLFEQRIEELKKNSSSIPAHEVIKLLRRADTNPKINIEKEISILKKNTKN